jgi:hypothetical protein
VSAPPPADRPATDEARPAAEIAELDALVGHWLTLPDVAEETGLDVGKVRRQVSERHLVGIRRGERHTFQVPAAFLVPSDMPGAGSQVLASVRGTVLVLADAGMTDAEILHWLFAPDDSIGVAPVEALRAGRKHEVRRVAQTLV